MKGNLGCEIDVHGIMTFTTCGECHYTYGRLECTYFRRDHGAKLGFVIEG